MQHGIVALERLNVKSADGLKLDLRFKARIAQYLNKPENSNVLSAINGLEGDRQLNIKKEGNTYHIIVTSSETDHVVCIFSVSKENVKTNEHGLIQLAA